MLRLALGLMMLATASATICGQLKGNSVLCIDSNSKYHFAFCHPASGEVGEGGLWGRGL